MKNPTTVLAESITELLQDNPIPELNLQKNYIVTVAIEDCDETLDEIYKHINKMIEQDKLEEHAVDS